MGMSSESQSFQFWFILEILRKKFLENFCTNLNKILIFQDTHPMTTNQVLQHNEKLIM